MRKLILLGVLAILLSMLASPVAAGVEDCEDLKNDPNVTKGLYGLCIAYWNAGNGTSQERILENYNKKKGPNDPPLIPDSLVFCPCWTPESLAEVTLGLTGAFCTHADGIFGWESVVLQDDPPVSSSVQVFAGELIDLVGIEGTSCAISINGAQSSASTSPEEDEECRAGVIALQEDPVFGFPGCV